MFYRKLAGFCRTVLLDFAANLLDFAAMKTLPPAPSKPGTWVQTERAAHEAWAALLRQSPRAAEMLHLLVAQVGEHNAVVISQKALARAMNRSLDTVQRAQKALVEGNWIEVRQIGDRGTVNAYVLNDRVVWVGPRDGLRYSKFSAQVIVSAEDQPDQAELGQQAPLRRIPDAQPGELQLPSGDGLPPPSQPTLPGMEPDLPARMAADDAAKVAEDFQEILDIAERIKRLPFSRLTPAKD